MSDCHSNCHRWLHIKRKRKSPNGLVTEYLIIMKMTIMNEQTNNTQAIFMEVTSRKVETLEEKIKAIEEKAKDIPDNTELIQTLLTIMEGLRSDIKSNALQPKAIQNLSDQMEL